MGLFDFFVAPLSCPHCGQVSPADSSTNMQTKVQAHPAGASLGIGDRLALPPEGLGDTYICLHTPAKDDLVTLLTTWECPACDQAWNWAAVRIDKGTIVSIESVSLTPALIEHADYISDDLLMLVADDEALSYDKLAALPTDELRLYVRKWLVTMQPQ